MTTIEIILMIIMIFIIGICATLGQIQIALQNFLAQFSSFRNDLSEYYTHTTPWDKNKNRIDE